MGKGTLFMSLFIMKATIVHAETIYHTHSFAAGHIIISMKLVCKIFKVFETTIVQLTVHSSY